MTGTAEPTGAGIWKRKDTVCSQFIDAQAASEDHHVELMWCCRTSAFSRRDVDETRRVGNLSWQFFQLLLVYCTVILRSFLRLNGCALKITKSRFSDATNWLADVFYQVVALNSPNVADVPLLNQPTTVLACVVEWAIHSATAEHSSPETLLTQW